MSTRLTITIQCDGLDSAVNLVKRIRGIEPMVSFSVGDVVITSESTGSMSQYRMPSEEEEASDA